MLRIDEYQLPELAFQHVPQRPPVLARRLHGDVGHLAVLQPCAHLPEIPRIRAELSSLDFEVRLLRRRQHTNGDTVLMDVNATTASILYFHNRLLPIAERRTPG
jgi:hypothetical protein